MPKTLHEAAKEKIIRNCIIREIMTIKHRCSDMVWAKDRIHILIWSDLTIELYVYYNINYTKITLRSYQWHTYEIVFHKIFLDPTHKLCQLNLICCFLSLSACSVCTHIKVSVLAYFHHVICWCMNNRSIYSAYIMDRCK